MKFAVILLSCAQTSASFLFFFPVLQASIRRTMSCLPRLSLRIGLTS